MRFPLLAVALFLTFPALARDDDASVEPDPRARTYERLLAGEPVSPGEVKEAARAGAQTDWAAYREEVAEWERCRKLEQESEETSCGARPEFPDPKGEMDPEVADRLADQFKRLLAPSAEPRVSGANMVREPDAARAESEPVERDRPLRTDGETR